MLNHAILHCSACGKPTQERFLEGRNRLVCDICGMIAYQNPNPASAVLLIEENRVLLVKRAMEPQKGTWALPAGFQEMDETPEQAARRELHEETGLIVGKLSLFDLVYHDSLTHKPVNVAIYLAHEYQGKLVAGDDVCEALFFPLGQLPQNLGFDYIQRCLSRLVETVK